jgi:plasmid replication initiation protein
MNNKLVVTKHNHLIEASYKLTLEEQRLILACIAKIDSRENGNIPSSITITAKEYGELFGIQLKHAYQQLREATDNLYERDIKIRDAKTRKRRRWVQAADYNDSQGSVSLSFSDYVKPYIGQLNGLFKSYQLQNVCSLKSIYSIRLYELLNQWRETGNRYVRLDDFKNMLQISDKYERYADLRKCVIEPAIKELNQKTDFCVSFKPEKQGKKIVRLTFNFSTTDLTENRVK